MTSRPPTSKDPELNRALEDADAEDGRDGPVTTNATGRVKFDDRGNAIWEWSVSTGKFGTDVSATRLRKLESDALSLADDASADEALRRAPSGGSKSVTAPVTRAPAPAAPNPKSVENRTGAVQGYSPYDSGLLIKAQEEVQRTKKKDLRRLGEWLKLRDQAGKNKTKGR
jgi:hypothetical protein